MPGQSLSARATEYNKLYDTSYDMEGENKQTNGMHDPHKSNDVSKAPGDATMMQETNGATAEMDLMALASEPINGECASLVFGCSHVRLPLRCKMPCSKQPSSQS